MSNKSDAERFLQNFFVKYKTFDIIFRDRPKNVQSLLALELTPAGRREIIESITVSDYSEGPLDDQLYGIASMWVFGKKHRNDEIYIKISMGPANYPVICISFHIAEHAIYYPFKRKKI